MTPPPRGAHLLEATLRIVAEQGLAGLGVRTVAAAAGVSPAQVQYYFRTKNDLIRAGYEYAWTQFVADLHAVITGEPSLARLHEIIDVWLPLDGRRERRARVWLAYTAAAAIDPALAAEAAQTDAELRKMLAAELTAIDHPDPATTAAQLLALIDGVTTQALVLPTHQRRNLAARTLTLFLNSLTPRAEHLPR